MMLKKISVFGLGYVGLSNSLILATKSKVFAYEIDQQKLSMLNDKKLPIDDREMQEFFLHQNLDIKFLCPLQDQLCRSDIYIICVPTDYDPKAKKLNTKVVDDVIESICRFHPTAEIVIKSTIPLGYCDIANQKYPESNIFFSPEFLREGYALLDNISPSRIIVGSDSKAAKAFGQLLKLIAANNPELIFTESKAAECIKLFSNTYLAMRVAFFNELDSFCLKGEINASHVIQGVSADKRIGKQYNNPSFGYGGYCLPKDTLQTTHSISDYFLPELISSINDSNTQRKKIISDEVLSKNYKKIGIYKLSMKAGSDNSRSSSMHDIITQLKANGCEVLVYDEYRDKSAEYHYIDDFEEFINSSDLIITNRFDSKLEKYKSKVFSRDITGSDN